MIERIVIRAGLTAVIGPNIVGQRAGGRRLGVARVCGDIAFCGTLLGCSSVQPRDCGAVRHLRECGGCGEETSQPEHAAGPAGATAPVFIPHPRRSDDSFL